MQIRGGQVKYERQRRGWTQRQLAEHAGLAPEYVGMLERGEKRGGIKAIAKLAEALEVSVESIAHIEQPA